MATTLCSKQGSYSSAYAFLWASAGTVTRVNATHARTTISWHIEKKDSTSYNENKYMLLVTGSAGSETVLGGAKVDEISKSTKGITRIPASGEATVTITYRCGNYADTSTDGVSVAISKSSSSVSSSGHLLFNGRTNTNTSPCAYQPKTLGCPAYTITVNTANGSYIGATSGSGTKQAGSSFSVGAAVNSYTGYTTTFSKWASSNTSIVANSTSKQYSFTPSSSYYGKTVTLTASATRSANSYTVTLEVNNSNYGTVSGDGTKTYGSSVTVTASIKNATYYTTTFSKWSGTYTNTSKSYTFTMPAGNVHLTANFTRTKNKNTITLSKGSYITSVSGFGTYDADATVPIDCVLTNYTGYTTSFDRWTGTSTISSKSYNYKLSGSNVNLTANATRTANSYKAKFLGEAYITTTGSISAITSTSGVSTNYWKVNGNVPSTTPISQNMTYNSSTTSPNVSPTIPTIEFMGWYEKSFNSTGKFNGTRLPTTWKYTSSDKQYVAIFSGQIRVWKRDTTNADIVRSCVIYQRNNSNEWEPDEVLEV